MSHVDSSTSDPHVALPQSSLDLDKLQAQEDKVHSADEECPPKPLCCSSSRQPLLCRANAEPEAVMRASLPTLLRQQEEGAGRLGRVRLSAAADAVAFADVVPLALLPGHRRPVIHLQVAIITLFI